MTADDRRRLKTALDEAARRRVLETKGWRICPRCLREQERTEYSPSSAYCKSCERERAAEHRQHQQAA